MKGVGGFMDLEFAAANWADSNFGQFLTVLPVRIIIFSSAYFQSKSLAGIVTQQRSDLGMVVG